MSSDLDTLLSRPLTEIPDGGFSARILAMVGKAEMRRARFEALGWIGMVLAATAALAMSVPGRALAAMALSLGAVTQIGVILTVVLLVFALRETAE